MPGRGAEKEMRHAMRIARSGMSAGMFVAVLLITGGENQVLAEGPASRFSDLPYAGLFESAPATVEALPELSHAVYQGAGAAAAQARARRVRLARSQHRW